MSRSADNELVLKRLAQSLSTISSVSQALHGNGEAIESATMDIKELPSAVKMLLKNLRLTTTSVALAFKPPITSDAAVQQLDKFTQEICQIITCYIGLGTASPVLAEDWKAGISDIIAEGEKLLTVLRTAIQSGESTSQDNPYLFFTGLVWEAIEKLLKDLPDSETQAVIKRWKMDSDLVRDAFNEFKEFEQRTVSDQPELFEPIEAYSGSEWMDDVVAAQTIRPGELKVIQAAKPLLTIYQILHAIMPKYLAAADVKSIGQQLVKASSSFVETFDETVCAFEPEQYNDAILDELKELDGKAMEIVGLTNGLNGDISEFLLKWRTRLSTEMTKWYDFGLKDDGASENEDRDQDEDDLSDGDEDQYCDSEDGGHGADQQRQAGSSNSIADKTR